MNRQDYYRLARNRIRISEGRLDPAAVDAPGSNINIIVNATSAMAEECEARASGLFAASLVATAQDTDLDRLILERSYNRLPRKGASAASFAVQLVRTGTAGGVVPAGTQMTAGGFTWTLDGAVIFQAGQLGPLPALFSCSVLGSAGNLGPDALAGFTNPGALFDPTLIIRKATVGAFDVEPPGNYASGGSDRETDSAYRARYTSWNAGLDRNTDNLSAGALGVPGVAYAEAVEDIDQEGLPIGSATLYVGDVNGRANAGLLARVRAAMRGFRLPGQQVWLFGTVPDLQSIVLSFGVREGEDIARTQDAARAAVVAAVNALLPGANLDRATLSAALRTVPGVVFLPAYPSGVVSPSSDIVAASTATLFRTRQELVGLQ